MKKIFFVTALIISAIGFPQDIAMENGTFNRCEPDRFFDSGGDFGNYGNDENLVTTICPQNAGDFIVLEFTEFTTQQGLNADIMTVYDGVDTSAPLIATLQGPIGPITIFASPSVNPSGCITVEFISSDSGNVGGWAANILCRVPCQDITASIDTIPAETSPNIVEILPGETVDFTGSATFSADGTNATYSWDFGDGNTATGTDVSNTFNTPGTYLVTLTVQDDNPTGCEDIVTLFVNVLDAIVTVNNPAFSESTMSLPELIENVFVTGEGCSSVDNFSFQVSGLPNETSSKSYGYFTKGGAVNFPFEEGIILTTGVAAQAGNIIDPNLVSNDNGQAGDNDLETALSQTNTNDATFIKFNFISPIGQIPFRYIMASEEYDGSTECSFADSFAFLLREVGTTTYTNIAVLPDGTPVSVTNINNSGFCTANPNFFAGYNIGETNYGGRTEVLTALVDVTPNVEYEIKLVVADQGDSIWDSAIFLEAGSFNLGGELGDDITIAAGTAECGGNSITLDTRVPTALNHTWFFNGVEILGENTSTIDIDQAGTYSVNVEFGAGCTTTDSILVEFRESPVANPAQNLEICDADDMADFDLSENDDDILGGQNPADFIITYHLLEQDAIDNVGALPTIYTNTVNGQTIWARIADNTQVCFSITSFQLLFSNITIDNPITPLQVCDDDTDGFTSFNLTERDADVIGPNNPDDMIVTYHLTQDDADNNVFPLPEPYINTAANNQTVYIRLQTVTSEDCYATATLDLEVIAPPIATMPTVFEVCDGGGDGFAEFDLGTKDPEVIGGQVGVTVTYHQTEGDAMMGTGILPVLYTNSTAGSELLYVRIENGSGCYDTTTLQLLVNPGPDVVEVSPYELCDDNNPGDAQEQFDLSTKDAEIINGQPNVTIEYYENVADADSGTNPIIGLYTNTGTPQTVIAVLTNTATGCTANVAFDLVVNPLPSFVVPTALEVCDDGVPDGFTDIDLSLKNFEVSGGNPGYSVGYYLTQAEADSGANPLPVPYTNISNPQTVFVRVEDIVTGCYDTTVLDLLVEQAPVANAPPPLRYCDPDNDGFGTFVLTDADAIITGGAAGLTVTYHETLANADNGVDALDTSIPYNNIVADNGDGDPPILLYARVESATIATDCATVVALELIVEPSPQISEPEPLEECDDASADGIAVFDLTSSSVGVLDGLDPLQYIVSYYETEDNADMGVDPIATPNAYTNTDVGMQTVWVRVEDTVTVEGCYKVTSLDLIVNPLPVLSPASPLELCDVNNSGDGQEAFILEDADAEILAGQTGITLTYYGTQDDADNATDPISSPYENTMNAQTVYVRGENDITGCYSTVTLTLRVDPVPSPEPDPTAIEVCDDDNDGFAEFDLEIRTMEITNGEPDVVVTYHETQEEADQGDNAITSPYTNIVANSQVVYVRSESTVTGCYSLTESTLELIVVPSPEVPSDLDPLVVCDDDDDGTAQFDLTEREGDILGGQDAMALALSYHVTAADAQTGDDPITNAGNYTNTGNPQVLYIRLFDPATGCFDTGELELRVDLPPVPVQPTPLELCDDLGEVPGDEVTLFDLTVKDVEITGGNSSWSVAYYETDADAQAQDNAIGDPTQYENTSVGGLPANPQTLYVVVTDTDTGCVAFTTMTLRVLPNPTPTPSDQLPALVLCDDINAGDGLEEFDLTANEVLILNGEAGVTATYHETAGDADTGSNAIADPAQYTNVGTPVQTVYVRVTNDITGCYAVVDFDIRVDPLPGVVAVTDFIQCELNTDGFDSFDLSIKDAEVLDGQDPEVFTVTYHEALVDAESGMNALVSPYINTANPQEIYVRITNMDTGCSISTQRFNLQVDEAAQANPDMEAIVYELCDDNMETDGDPFNDSVQFDLASRDGEVLDGQSPADYIVTYYANEEDANLGVNPLPDLYENIINPQVIYARVDNNTLAVLPIALDLGALTAGLDLDGDGTIDTIDTDGDGTFDLIDVDGDGLSDGIDANADGLFDFVDIDGDGLGDPVDLDNDGTFDNQQDGSICFAVAPLTLQVNPLPLVVLDESYILCVNTNGTEVLDPLVLDTGLSEGGYGFEWSFNGTVLAGETGAALSPLQGGSYSVTVTDLATSSVTSCSSTAVTEVIESEPPVLVAEVTTQAFSENHVIVATAGPGDPESYEYSLDGGPWQGSGTFSGVSPGLHEVTARDRDGCGLATVEVFVLDYPRYFTPNGDGNHDSWNIAGIGNSAKIYIFDRYGKLLKQLSPSGPGWDGTYNGNRMPTSDYWFVVEFDEPATGQRRELRAHFALKR